VNDRFPQPQCLSKYWSCVNISTELAQARVQPSKYRALDSTLYLYQIRQSGYALSYLAISQLFHLVVQLTTHLSLHIPFCEILQPAG
jgi:hypothetical protein